MNIIDLTLFKVNIMASPFLLLNYFVGRKDPCETTKHKTVPKSYYTWRVRAPLGHYICNRFIPTCCVEIAGGSCRHKLRRTDRNGKGEKETEQRTDELSDRRVTDDVIEIPE